MKNPTILWRGIKTYVNHLVYLQQIMFIYTVLLKGKSMLVKTVSEKQLRSCQNVHFDENLIKIG